MVKTVTRAADIPMKGIVAVDFFATWCGPCKRVGPQFEAMVSQYPTVTFLKVDIDAAAELADAHAVRAVPTFLVLQDGKVVRRVEGADLTKVEIQLNKLTGW